MEKLEKHIRNTLGQREITPSPQAWERISGELEGERTRNNKKFPFIAIAASVLAILALSILVFMVKSEEDKTNSLADVEESNEPQLENDVSVPTILNEKDGELVETNSKEIENTSVTNNKAVIPVENNNKVTSIQSALEPQEKVALIADSEFSKEVITLKMNEVLAEVIAMENDSVQVTDAEIDSLLMIAQRQLLTKGMSNESPNGVNALALLNEVELELLESDRNQLFDKLRESFFKLRTAVADRNK